MLPKSKLFILFYFAAVLSGLPASTGWGIEDDLALDMDLDIPEESEPAPPLPAPQAITSRASEAISSVVKNAPTAINNLIPVNFKDKMPDTNASETKSQPQLDLLTRVKNKKDFSTKEIENWVLSQEDINTCMENGKTMLIYLVSGSNNIEAVRFLLDNGAAQHTHCTPQYEALFVALKEKASIPMIETLINNGANIVDTDVDGNTALIYAAAYHPNPEVITTLLEFGLKLDAKNKFGFDALTMAAYHNNLPVVQIIADNLINTNARDTEGRTPLMAAAVRGNDVIMQYLIKQGADFNAADNNGVTVWDYYNKRSYLQTLGYKPDPFATLAEQLNQEYNFIAQNHIKYNTMLQQGIYQQNADEAVADAIAHNADIDKLHANGCTTLLNAAIHNAPISVLEKLLNAKAAINAVCLNGQNALMHTITRPENLLPAAAKTEKVRFFVNRGIDLNAADDNGDTALILAVKNNAPAGVQQVLLQYGANINAANKSGATALITGLQQQISQAGINLLLQNGADTNQPDNSGETPLWHAIQNHSSPLAVQALLQNGANANTPNANGETPLWYALLHNLDEETTALLAAADKNLNELDANGETPLLFALKNDLSPAIVKAMLANGADPQQRGRDGKNAYDILKSKKYFNEALKKQTRNRVLDNWEK